MPKSRRPFQRVSRLTVLALLAGLFVMPVFADTATAAVSPLLARYPYLTDSVQNSITLNWATTTTGGHRHLRPGGVLPPEHGDRVPYGDPVHG
jgi:hypothetical protein